MSLADVRTFVADNGLTKRDDGRAIGHTAAVVALYSAVTAIGLLVDRGPVWVLVNTLGATPLMEGLVVLRRVAARLREQGIALHRARVGEYITSLEMAGVSLTLTALDDELRRLLDAPARALAAPPLDEPW